MRNKVSIEIGKRLKFFREKKGLTQVKMAEKMGIKQQVISQYEQGKRNITVLSLIKYCEILEVELALFDVTKELDSILGEKK